MHDDYKPLPMPDGHVELCPCCGGMAELWQYSTADDAPCTKVMMCATNEPIGPQDGLTNEGCPLYMPPDHHYRATIREAVKFWNDFAKALTALQRKNRWASANVLRQDAAAPTTSGGEQP